MSERRSDGAEPRKGVSRRNFLNTSVVVGGGVIFSLAAAGCASKAGPVLAEGSEAPAMGGSGMGMAMSGAPSYRLALDEAAELRQIGGVRRVRYMTYDFFLVRESEASILALKNECTHRQCKTKYDASARAFACPCHGSRFDLDGNAIKGPAIAPLARYPVTLSEGIVNVVLQG